MRLLFLLIFLQICAVNAQSHKDSILEFQNHLNEEYKNPEKSPLTKKDLKTFKGHVFYPINEKFNVKARFEKVETPVPFLMKTTTERLPTYEIYGIATFEIDNQQFKLNIYQSLRLRAMNQYKNYLFLPFTDLTNGNETYGGGRFIDLEVPNEDFIMIDFNKAYNPYCVYDPKYSCPIPPKENDLQYHITAGIKK
ncbi:MAG: DUF1684 domain-containing protein [Flavobacteriaceae bacterium]